MENINESIRKQMLAKGIIEEVSVEHWTKNYKKNLKLPKNWVSELGDLGSVFNVSVNDSNVELWLFNYFNEYHDKHARAIVTFNNPEYMSNGEKNIKIELEIGNFHPSGNKIYCKKVYNVNGFDMNKYFETMDQEIEMCLKKNPILSDKVYLVSKRDGTYEIQDYGRKKMKGNFSNEPDARRFAKRNGLDIGDVIKEKNMNFNAYVNKILGNDHYK